jgi:hypothetical protein
MSDPPETTDEDLRGAPTRGDITPALSSRSLSDRLTNRTHVR